MSFGDVGVVTLSPWIHSVRWCKVRSGRRFSSSGFTTKLRRPCVYTRTVEFDHQPQLILDFAQKDVEHKTNEVSEKSPDCMGMEQRKRKQAAAAQL